MGSERHRVTGHKMIGYLTGDYPKGNVPADFIEKLKQIEKNCAAHVLSMGHHTCEYCFPGGDDELRKAIESGRINWDEAQRAMSSGECHFGDYIWPDMLTHYIMAHQYLPPQEFVNFIIDFNIHECPKDNEVNIEYPELDF